MIERKLNSEIESALEAFEEEAETIIKLNKVVEDVGQPVAKEQRIVKIELTDEELSNETLLIRMIAFFNSKEITMKELIDYFMPKCDEDERIAKRSVNNLIKGLIDRRGIRIDTLEMLCEILNVDIILEPKKGHLFDYGEIN